MTIAMPDTTFGTAASDPQAVQTRVLVISHIPGMSEMVARNVGRGDPTLTVSARRITLTDLAAEGVPADTDLVIFDIRPGDDGDLAAAGHYPLCAGTTHSRSASNHHCPQAWQFHRCLLKLVR